MVRDAKRSWVGMVTGGMLVLGIGFAGGRLADRSTVTGSEAVGMPFDQWKGPVAWEPTNAPPDAVEVEVREQRMTLETLTEAKQALVDERERLRARVGELEPALAEAKDQVRGLTEAMATERVNADLLRAQLERQMPRPLLRQQDLPPGGLTVVDVDDAVGLVALDAGLTSGVRIGMKFHVLRDDRRIAGVTVVDVREHLAAAEVEDAAADGLRAGDRAVAVKPVGP